MKYDLVISLLEEKQITWKRRNFLHHLCILFTWKKKHRMVLVNIVQGNQRKAINNFWKFIKLKDFITANSRIVGICLCWHCIYILQKHFNSCPTIPGHDCIPMVMLIHSTQDSVGTVCIKRHCGHTLANLQMISTFFIVFIHMEPHLAPFEISVHWQWLHLLAPATDSSQDNLPWPTEQASSYFRGSIVSVNMYWVDFLGFRCSNSRLYII